MLVLSRKTDEAIIVGDNIKITIIEVKHDHVRIGIDAPKDVTIYRKEIYDQIQEQNREAAKAPSKAEDLAKLADLFKAPSDPADKGDKS